jgi:hypothetical protein
LFGRAILKSKSAWSPLEFASLLIIPTSLFSMVGAGARGMELGTYAGIFFTLIMFKVAFDSKKNTLLNLHKNNPI